MTVKEKSWLTRAKKPENAGVNSRVVQDFIDRCAELNKEVHSIMVIRNDKIACEAYKAPFDRQYNHMMYSVSKSFTSTAIGFAVHEGYFTVDTRFVDIFPEARGDKYDEYLEEMTVEDLLTMRSGKSVSVFLDRTKDRWFKDIINSPWISEPGTEFLYISENMYLLCCIIHKMCGMSVMEYLKPRLFEPLGIKNPFWETCPRGIEAGGWGMMITTEDLAKFTYCYSKGGKFGGKQVIPAEWVEEATKYHADSSVSSQDSDCKEGYGYCFWKNGGCENSYRADGMFCQFGIVFEDYNACLIITAGEVHEQGLRDVLWEYFPRAFTEKNEGDSVTVDMGEYERLPEKNRSALEQRIEGKLIKLMKPIAINIAGYPTSVVPLPALFMESDKAGNISDVCFRFHEKEMEFSWTEGDESNSINIGMDGEYRWDNIVIGKIPYTTCSTACWNTDSELEVRIRCIEVVAERVLTFKFNGDNVVMRPSSNPSVSVMAETMKNTVKDVIKQPMIQNAVSKALPKIVPLIDAAQRGKIKF